MAERCLIRNNGSYHNCYNGNGVILFSGTGACVRDCVITNNYDKGSVIGSHGTDNGTGIDCVVTNCLIGWNRLDGNLIKQYHGQGTIIDSCVIISNATTTGTMFVEGESPNSDQTSPYVRFRNCFVRGNKAASKWAKGLSVTMHDGKTNSLDFEYCTFLDAIQDMDIICNGATYGTNLVPFVRIVGCCFRGMGVHPDYKNCATYTWAGNLVYDNATGNLRPADYPNGIGFADEANGDFSLTSHSPLKDKGGAVEAWMGDGSRKGGTRDLGTGSMSFEPSGLGVVVKVENSKPRLSNNRPDIGCFEYLPPTGLCLLFK